MGNKFNEQSNPRQSSPIKPNNPNNPSGPNPATKRPQGTPEAKPWEKQQ